MKQAKEKNIHAEHRQRLKSMIRQVDIKALPEVNVLEFLLYYSIPYKDTNPIAHRLLDEYGSLAGVFEASYEDLLNVEGVGEHTALLLTTMPKLFKQYAVSKWDELPYFGDVEIYGNYARDICIDLAHEEFYIICLNNDKRLLRTERVSVGSIDQVTVYMREAALSVLRSHARYVVLAHNHPSGRLLPSSQDLQLTAALVKVFTDIHVTVLDHIIVGGGKYYSFREQRLPLGKEGLGE